MPHALAQAVEIVTTALAVAGMGYFLAAMVAAWAFLRGRRAPLAAFAPGVSILKSLKGLDPGMMEAFRSHCRQSYAGEFELLFGVASPDDPAAAAVELLQNEFPQLAIQLIVCPERLGTNAKVSTLVQMAPHARYDFLLINDSDITVSPHYLDRVMACFAPEAESSGARQGAEKGLISIPVPEKHPSGAKAHVDFAALAARLKPCPFKTSSFPAVCKDPVDSGALDVRAEARTLQSKPVGLVTALYRGRAHGTLASRLEALGIAMDFQPGVLLSKVIEGGLHYGLGSTLAVRREALDRIGGLLPLVDYLGDDYQLGRRVSEAGYRVALSAEVVETAVPAYGWRDFVDHQLRWNRVVRDSRPGGYVGLIFTHGLGWALVNVLACALSPLSLGLLGLSLLLRMAMAVTVGVAVLGDRRVLRSLGLLPLRDLVAMGIWLAGFAGNTIVWRGERFVLKNGKLRRVS
jgi:ceramide glucosyltransferase